MLPPNLFLSILSLLISAYFHRGFSVAIDTFYPNQSISDGQTLTSAGGLFKLGFFSPNNSTSNRYLAIWYNLGSMEQAILWVANRENPLTDPTGILGFDEVTSNLVLTDASNKTFWSSNITTAPALANNIMAKLLDRGNLVLLHHDGREMWSSFDQLTDTFVPTSEMSFNLKTKKNNTIINWKSKVDPSPGNFALGFSRAHFYQGFVYVNGSKPYWRTGPWIGKRFVGIADMGMSSDLLGLNVYNSVSQDEIRFSYMVPDDTDPSSSLSRLVLDSEGLLVHWYWNKTEKRWMDIWKKPENRCDLYGNCGEFAVCNPYGKPICSCMKGFEPRFGEDWGNGSFSGGCKRIVELACRRNGSGDAFFKIEGLKLPDSALYQMSDENGCRKWCSDECRCLAYAHASEICIIWADGLLDVRTFQNNGEILYVKLHPSSLDHAADKKLIVIFGAVLGSIFICGVPLLLLRRRKQKERRNRTEALVTINPTPIFEAQVAETFDSSPPETGGLELLLYDFKTIFTAANDFHSDNKLGEGGFGPVYKGVLQGGQQIAVKRLSRQSRQGLKQFKNEVLLISKLQHQNLVRLLGFCIKEEEKLLIYEFMPNKSLDAFLFVESNKNILDWSKRFNIIEGIARGLLYLHQDSRWRIIHRDLKAGNILLDEYFNPKISDFGTATIFGTDQVLETNAIVGTLGYISPEYTLHGQFSEKSDVYSFGVLVLEILSGKRINAFYDEHNSLNLLGYAWKLWKEENVLEFIDSSLRDSWPPANTMKCITMALLCVQELPSERPTMSHVVSMLTSANADTHMPKEPPFFGRRTPFYSYSSSGRKKSISVSKITLTDLQGR